MNRPNSHIHALALCLLLGGCGDAKTTQGDDAEKLIGTSMSEIVVVPDKKRGVICYVYAGYGLSCIKESP